MTNLLQEFRFALRGFARKPSVNIIATLTLALGIGGTVAVFSTVDALLLRELPYHDPNRIVTIWQTSQEQPDEREGVSPGAFMDWRDRATVFSQFAAAEPMSFDYLGGPEPETLIGALVTNGFFEALGVTPRLGRSFLPEEHVAGKADVVLLSYGAWQRRFAGDPTIVGRRLQLEGRPYVIIGVLPQWLKPRLLDRDHEIWAPKVLQESERASRRTRYWAVVGRLSPSVTIQTAQDELSSVSRDLAREFPNTMASVTATIEPWHEHLVAEIRQPLWLLFGAVTLVLLIACANVMNLLLARGAERRREVTIRLALGASRWRIVRQMLAESLLLGAISAAGGVLLAHWALDAFVAVSPVGLLEVDETWLRVNARSLAFALALAGATSALFGMWPAIRLSRGGAHHVVSETETRATATTRHRDTSALVIAEVAVAFVLLVSAGLLIRSFISVLQVDPGFARSEVAVAQVFVYGQRYPDNTRRVQFFERSLERIRALPGVSVAGVVSAMPFGRANIGIQGGFRVEGRPEPAPDQRPTVFLTVATEGYFRAMSVPLRRGRLFADADRADMPSVALVNELIAARYWPNQDPIGQRITVNWQGRERTMEVVGVVGPIRHDALDREARAEVFMPFAQVPFGSMTFVTRSSSDPAALIPAIKQQIWSIDPTLPIYATATLHGLVDQSVGPRRFLMQLLSALALLAFVLAAAGIYAVLSFSIVQRTRELGVRMAIGADSPIIVRLVVGEGMRMVGVGALIGVLGALGVSQFLRASLFQVSATDPLTLILAMTLLAVVALVACYVPARRAARVDPLVALRYE